ncbi:MAG: hypothetical protein U0575_14745 [Phycisphaerales bacterium]
MFGATPTEAVSRASRRMSARMRCAIVRPSPCSRSDPVTSRNASSTLSGCTSGVYRSKIAKTWSETSR